MAAEKTDRLRTDETEFRKRIEEFYLPKQLVDAIYDLGEIPKQSRTSVIGVGFIDIADYTFLSKFLSPVENQVMLNGLYTAFNWVLKRHGGYLNKIEGDSLMFHFGGITDPHIKKMTEEESTNYIARELFYTCVEMQRVCILFNQANDKFIYENADESTLEALRDAFQIISALRNNFELRDSINALFQIRIRIGANIGEVTIGNFGPDGAKQWDIIGMPVIVAKRMESTAPIGGLRISSALFDILSANGIVDAYFNRFKREAQALFGQFRGITKEELFKFGKVLLKDKKNVEFDSYSVQVNPGLPEAITEQVFLLLEKGDQGTDKIQDLLKYYRGNKFVIDAIENTFKQRGIVIRKEDIIRLLFPKKYDSILEKMDGDAGKSAAFIAKKYSLYLLLDKLGEYQDAIKFDPDPDFSSTEFESYGQYIRQEEERIMNYFNLLDQTVRQRAYFYNVVYPMVFKVIRTSILEYQYRESLLEEVS